MPFGSGDRSGVRLPQTWVIEPTLGRVIIPHQATVSDMSPEDIDEVARIIAENRQEAGERVRRQHSELHKKNSFAIEQAKKYVEELKKYMRPSSEDLRPSITEINMRSGLDEVLVEGDIILTP
uniref:V-type ATP synthase subunit D n=1 Tax=Steinernema glaseri TaxID=37863 RepID=A0A1I7Y6N3_9BILA